MPRATPVYHIFNLCQGVVLLFLLLPVKENGELDIDFMSSYMRQKEIELLSLGSVLPHRCSPSP